MNHDMLEPSLFSLKAILILDINGNRLLAQYYDPPERISALNQQREFEKELFSKTNKANAEIASLEGFTIVYRNSVDVFFYVVGSSLENELLLFSALNTLFDSISLITKKNVEHRNLLSNLEAVYLAVDEICDGGIIIESDPEAVASRCCLRQDELSLSDQTVADVLQKAKEQIRSGRAFHVAVVANKVAKKASGLWNRVQPKKQ